MTISEPAVELFRGLADPTRLAILQHLTLGEHRVVDLTAHLGLAQSTVSQHVACLRGCGLLSARTEGRSTLYALARPELLDLLAAAERLLEATGNGVVLCPTPAGGA
jgi:DNA-binding transcriptional ArsR family regulator